MKNLSFSMFKIISIVAILLLMFVILIPFNLINMEQAQRIAKWKSVYENIKYSFSLVKLHEGTIVPNLYEAEKVVNEEYIMFRVFPFLNLKSNELIKPYKYGYRKMNGSPVIKNSQFYFDKFVERKDGTIIGIKENNIEVKNENQPLYFMFVDINGKQKPNRIGQDIFIINIFKDYIHAMGKGKTNAALKSNCSPISSGLYCSEYYLLGGRF